MPRIIKTAWGDQKKTATVCNAYNNIKDNDIVIDLQGNIIGVATTYRARATWKSPGSVELINDDKEIIWLSGDVINIENNTWVLTSNANLR